MKPDFPEVIIFDVDGVLVDVRESFHRTALETVRFFTGQRVSRRELYRWKSRTGYNDDWKVSHRWIRTLGRNRGFEEVKKKFEEIYWGRNCDGNVARERWMLPIPILRRLGRNSELALFTGRTRRELEHAFRRFPVRSYFQRIVTVEDIEHPKPHPEGIFRILGGRIPSKALFVGDNVDDALAASRAGVKFVGVLLAGSEARRYCLARLHQIGARIVLGDVCQLDKFLARGGLR